MALKPAIFLLMQGDIQGLDRSVSQDGSDTDGLVYNRNSIGSAVVLERLQSLLKQKEGELANVQVTTTHVQ